MHTVPYGFKFPSFEVSIMWNLWIYGDASKEIGPYHQISSEHDLVDDVCKSNRSRTKKVINYMVKVGIDNGLITRFADLKEITNSQKVFAFAYPNLLG